MNDSTKTCRKCGQARPLDKFSLLRKSGGGRRLDCNPCRAEAARLARLADPEKAREHERRYREANPGRQREAEKRYRERHPEKPREAARRWKLANREAVFDHYGWTCACCGSAERPTIDHVNGDGMEHRRREGINSGSATHHWLVRNGFPDGFQTLCLPCNVSKKSGSHCRLDHTAAVAA